MVCVCVNIFAICTPEKCPITATESCSVHAVLPGTSYFVLSASVCCFTSAFNKLCAYIWQCVECVYMYVSYIASMRDVHFVISVALPYVNYIHHIVKTCIRRNFNPYPITMHKFIWTSSAIYGCLSDEKCDVINCASWIPKLSKTHKARVVLTFLKEQNIQVLGHPTHTVLTCLMRLLVVPPHQWKVNWAVIFWHSFQALAKAVNSELHALSPSDYQNAFESWHRWPELYVCKAEESTLKECECFQ